MKSKIILFLKNNPNFLIIIAVLHNLFFLNIVFNFSSTNKIITKGVFLKNTKFKVSGYNNIIKIHPECKLNNCLLYIKGDNCKIIIGKHCSMINTAFWIEDDSGIITIGGQTTIEGAHLAATEGESIRVGEDCMFSSNIQIRNGDSHPIYDIKTDERINNAIQVIIGNHVWIGYGVTILKGSKIADNSIIATGAVVTGSFNVANSIYGGTPAKTIKENIKWERQR